MEFTSPQLLTSAVIIVPTVVVFGCLWLELQLLLDHLAGELVALQLTRSAKIVNILQLESARLIRVRNLTPATSPAETVGTIKPLFPEVQSGNIIQDRLGLAC